MSDVVVREETPVVFIRCSDDLAAIRDAWARLEGVVPLRGTGSSARSTAASTARAQLLTRKGSNTA